MRPNSRTDLSCLRSPRAVLRFASSGFLWISLSSFSDSRRSAALGSSSLAIRLSLLHGEQSPEGLPDCGLPVVLGRRVPPGAVIGDLHVGDGVRATLLVIVGATGGEAT